MTLVAVPATADEDTIVSTVVGSDDFDILEAAVGFTGTAGALDDVTVFAPTDKAFTKLAEDLGATDLSEAGVISFLVGLGKPTVTAVLTYHVAEGELLSGDVVGDGQVEALGGTFDVFAPGKAKSVRSIQLVDNDPDARNPKLVKGAIDIQVSDGVIHVIDRVLRPIDL
jgi:uncharacterized surface protein with fasciclin (FAS1) repeats